MKKIDYKKIFVQGYILLVTCIVPFITFDKYFDLTKSKGMTFIGGSILLLVFYLLTSSTEEDSVQDKKLSLIEMMCILFCAVAFVSFLFARPIIRSLWGDAGTYMGFLTFVVGIMSLLILVRSDINLDKLIKVICVCNMFMLSINILHAMRIDIFNMHEGISKIQYFDYLGTLGNVNWIVGYLAIMLIIFLDKYLKEEGKWKTLYFIFLVIVIFNIHLIHSDAIYLSLAAAGIFLVPYIFKNKEYVLKCLKLMLVYILCGLIINLPMFLDFRLGLSGISKVMINPLVLSVLLFITSVMYGCILKCKNYNGKWFIVVLEVIIVLAISLVIIDLINHYLSYNYYWGNNRLQTWVHSGYVYKYYYTDMNRIFGVGPDMLYYVYEEISAQYGATLINAHNCFVQVLMSMGIVGLIVFILLIVSVIYEVKRKGLYNKSYFIYFVCLVAFFAQSLVNNMNGNNIGLFILIFAIFIKGIKKVENNG